MNRKFMLNAAVATLMALGLAACSSGGSKVEKSAGKHVKPDHQGHHGHKAPNTEKGVKNVYGAAVAFNINDGKIVLDSAAKSVKYSDAHELKIDNEKVVLREKYSFNFMREKDWKYQSVSKFNFLNAKDDREAAFVTLGYQTPTKDIPQAGEATYKGKAYGSSMIDVPNHNHSHGAISSDVTVKIDFAKKMVDFKTENSMLNNKKDDGFDLTGAAKLDSAKNQFVDGVLKMKQHNLPGKFEGHLYGPKGEEVGGTFNVYDSNIIGGFGAKK